MLSTWNPTCNQFYYVNCIDTYRVLKVSMYMRTMVWTTTFIIHTNYYSEESRKLWHRELT